MLVRRTFDRRAGWRAPSLLLSATALALFVSGPVASQESILPPGLNEPVPPAPAPAPSPTPTPTPGPAPSPGPSPRPSLSSDSADEGEDKEDDEDADESEDDEPRRARYDLPPSARRSLDRVGLIGNASGGLASDAFGQNGGQYLSILMRETTAPIASRWATILLRRTLLSALDTPRTIDGADWVAARAGLLLRMGDAIGARSLVQSVDIDNATPRLLAVALETYLANADPGGLCPLVEFGLARSNDDRWEMARAMCASMAGESGVASSSIDRARRRLGAGNMDVLLAQRIVGAGVRGRRSATIVWDDVGSLDNWRLGLATATGLEIPSRLTDALSPRMQAFRATAPMTPMTGRIAAAPWAAALGAMSARNYVDLLGLGATSEEAEPSVAELADALRRAERLAESEARVDALEQIWGEGNDYAAYGRLVLTARAAAATPVGDVSGGNLRRLVSSMLSAGFDRHAARWASRADSGSRAWAMIALGAPTDPYSPSSGDIDRFQDNDESIGSHATGLLVAGLAGLGRIDAELASEWSEELDLGLARSSRWTWAIDRAVARRQQGTVALLVAVGMQGTEWDKVTPLQLYHVVSALRRVGLEPEARMIAAEAIART